jgi:flagellar hook-associated protein 2
MKNGALEMGMSVDGLVTGMSTTDTVNQLMQVEALPQTALKTKVGVQNKVVAAYQGINSKFAALVTAAKAVGDSNTWASMKTTSSSDAAAVTAQPGASAGSLSFKVDSLAAGHMVTYSDQPVASTAAQVLSGSSLTIKLADGTFTDLTPTDGSLQSVVSAINGQADAAYKAAAVQIGPGKFTLQLTSKTTGESSEFPPPAGIDPALLGGGNTVTQGSDAKISIGTTNPYVITSTSNTFADVLPGVTVTAARLQTAEDAPVTITLTEDSEGISTKVQALVDGANAVLTEIRAQSRTKDGAVSAGPLVGDSAVRALSQKVLGAVAAGVGVGGIDSLSKVGVSLDRGGKLTFDKDAFTKAYAADPVGTQAFFDSYTPATLDVDDPRLASLDADAKDRAVTKANDPKFQPGWDTEQLGLARRLETIALQATEGLLLPTDAVGTSKQGIMQGLIERRNDSIRQLNDQVAAWDVRLELRKTALQRQFSNLEVAMGKMQQQSSWLSGQLSSLPTY